MGAQEKPSDMLNDKEDEETDMKQQARLENQNPQKNDPQNQNQSKSDQQLETQFDVNGSDILFEMTQQIQ